ncbi:MAG TPA: hypothetical protein VF810_03035 [Patescibacteria group bacterium]
MELSLLLAKIIGLTFMLTSIALLVNRKNIDLLFRLYSHLEAIFITGFLETVLGLILIVIHNLWLFDFRGLITAIGWILLLRGLGRLIYPERSLRIIAKFKSLQKFFVYLLIVVFLIGCYLTYTGFMTR